MTFNRETSCRRAEHTLLTVARENSVENSICVEVYLSLFPLPLVASLATNAAAMASSTTSSSLHMIKSLS
jgi:hypothetical protein